MTKKYLIYGFFLLAISAAGVNISHVSAASPDYDAETNDLVANILQILDNDVPPVEETGNNVVVFSSNEIIAMNVLVPFVQKNDNYVLTSKSLNERRNGGVLLKDPQAAIDYMASQKLTKYTTVESFQSDAPLRRDEAAKFFSLFAKQVMNKNINDTKECTFKDMAEGHTDLQSDVITACKLGIFNGKDGFFNPTKSLTNGEALAVLIRIVDGAMDETNSEHRAKAYWQKAQSYGLTQGTFLDSAAYLDQPMTRGNMARLLEAASYIAPLKLQLGGNIAYSFTAQGFVRTN